MAKDVIMPALGMAQETGVLLRRLTASESLENVVWPRPNRKENS